MMMSDVVRGHTQSINKDILRSIASLSPFHHPGHESKFVIIKAAIAAACDQTSYMHGVFPSLHISFTYTSKLRRIQHVQMTCN